MQVIDTNKSRFFSSHSVVINDSCISLYVTPHHQMRHKSEIQKLRYEHNVKDENIGLKMVKELCFYYNYKLNYD